MTWTVLASVAVDHLHPSIRNLSVSASQASSASRPGTPIVTPRVGALSAHPSPSRPASRIKNLNLPLEENLEEVGEEEEGKENSSPSQENNGDDTDTGEELVSTFSAVSLSSTSEADTVGSLPPPSTPRTVRENHLRRPETSGANQTCGKPHCARGRLRVTSRALTAASSSYKTRHSKYCSCTSAHHSEVSMVDAQVIYASSHDPKFPPSAAVDGRRDTFWASSGLYPQILVVSLPGLTSVENVNIIAYNVRKISIARSIKKQPTDFEEITNEELIFDEGKLQESSPALSKSVSAIFLKITIEEGYDHFCAVHKVSVKGSVSNANRNSGFATQAQSPVRKPSIPTPSSIPTPTITDTTNRNVVSVNEIPRYQRPQSPDQIISQRNGLTNVAPLGGHDEIHDNMSDLSFQSVTNIRNMDDDDF